jgi:hypothetical protein
MFALAQSDFPFSVQLSDAGSGGGRSFVPQLIQVHSRNLFGTAERPMPLPTPYVFSANQNITGNFTDLAGLVGTAGVTNGSPVVTWVSGGTGFNTSAAFGPPFPGTPIWAGSKISLAGVTYVILSVQSQNQITLAQNYAAGTATVAFAVSNTIRVAFKGVELSA